jgi:hypothetical protein
MGRPQHKQAKEKQMEKVIYISTENDIEVAEVDEISYDTLYEGVNGLVELVSLNRDVDMWVNEEGKVNGLEPNLLATLIWNKIFPNPDVIMGNVVITGGVDEEGNTLGLSEESIQDIMALLHNGLIQAINEKEKE